MSAIWSDVERRFGLLVESIEGYGVYMLDLDGRVVSWNRGAERIKGYQPAEIIGQPFSRFFTIEDRRAGMPDKLLAEALRAGRTESEGWRIRKDGQRFWAMSSLQALRGDRGEAIGFAKITRDMTQEREARQALIESERRFRLLVEGVVDYAIYLLDINGVVTNWNRGAERIKGYGAAEIVGRHFATFYTPEERGVGLPAKALATALSEGRFEGEGWRVRKDGSRFWAMVVIDPIHDDDGRHIGYAKVTRDISERKAADEALKASERQFRLLVGGVVDYALYMLDPNGIVVQWNVGAERIKGYAAEEIIGQHVSRFYTPADRASGAPLRGLSVAAAEGRFECEGWRVRKDGTHFWANVVIDAIHDEKGDLVGFAKITRDITDKKNAEADLHRAQERVAQAHKMEALGQLTGGVAHDFNNLLMIVSGQAQLVRRKIGDDPGLLRSLEAIETAAARGADLTRQLLSFARRQRLQTTVAPFAQRMGGVRELVSTSLPGNIRLEVELPDDLWPVEVDQGELDLALLNLAVNARDAMPSGGVLKIAAENVHLPENGPSGLVGDHVAVTVSDTGVGIPSDILRKVFEPFFTTKAVDKGTGLGLSQVFGFARQAGGDVTVASELGGGARFVIHIPRWAGESGAAAPQLTDDQAAERGDAEPAQGASILVVEDNPDVAEVAVAMLEQLGHRVRVAGAAAAALRALQDGEPPDLVFSDIVMAGDMDGLGLARLLKQQHPRLPVLLATGYSQAAEKLGAEFPLIRKPYTMLDLHRSVNSLLAGARNDTQNNLVSIDEARRDRAVRAGRVV
ncbi:MAG: hypothetical protein JWO83_3953 [Caulobacteraceae bacterium]|nr:hypothetical protein [Caulobacteraceae bacterium]